MNLRNLLFASILTVFTVSVYAAPVDPARAINVAEQFMPAQHVASTPGKAQAPAQQQTPEIVYTHYMPKSGRPAIYVINISGGFALVSADDVAHPVLGYNYGKPWPTDVDSLAPSVKGFLDDLAAQMEAASEHPQDTETAAEWQQPRHAPNRAPRRVKMDDNLPDSVGPLLTTTWDQGQYYNAMCPEDSQSPYDGHCPTGCVATAMAQIIKYWGDRETIHPRGIHSYETLLNIYGTLTVNYDSAVYNFDVMPNQLINESSEEEINAVATLMYHCGVANVMTYGAGGSSAISENTRTAFINNFGFSPNLGYADRHLYTEDEWLSLMRYEINHAAPIFYSARDPYGTGHAFVLDGYKNDNYVHFNFGWSGSADGWYLISAVTGLYNSEHFAILGIRPDNTSNSLLCHSVISNPNHEYYTIDAPMHLYNMSANNKYRMDYQAEGRPIILHFSPRNPTSQLVLDVLRFDEECAVAVYDGNNKDSLIRVIETRSSNTPIPYDYQPSDTLLQQNATTEVSPIVSMKHGFTIIAYSYGLKENEFHLRISEDESCRMVSNIKYEKDSDRYRINWQENGSAKQWQVSWLDSLLICDTTSVLISDLSTDSIFEVRVRANCGNYNSEWNSIILNKPKYWSDIVVAEPEGYVLRGDTVFVSSAEGLAWWRHLCNTADWPTEADEKTLVIESDIDLKGYLWKPIRYYGRVIGNGHVIKNLETGYTPGSSGLFSYFQGDTLSDLHLINSHTYGDQGKGSLAGIVDHSVIMNCSSINHKVSGKHTTVGGLVGGADNSKIINCFAIGETYSANAHGGLVGSTYYSEYINCYSSVKSSTYNLNDNQTKGLLTGSVTEGTYDNCFANIEDIKMQKYFAEDSLNIVQQFFGNINSQIRVNNVAAFKVQGDTVGKLIPDTAVNFGLEEGIDLLTVLNYKVVEQNSSDLRIWVWDSTLHLPVLGDFYEPTCPNVSNVIARNIEYNDGYAVALTWHENGDAQKWQVKYLDEDTSEEDAVVYSVHTTTDTILGLTLGKDYTFYVRPICEDEDTVGWGQPIKLFVDKLYWKDVVTECPKGYVLDSEGNVEISTAEGLAWLINHYYGNGIVSITKDLDMGAYRWTPLYCDYTIEGNNHVISNLICRESSFSENSREVGFVKAIWNGTIRNLIIKDGIFYGSESVGGIAGAIYGGAIDNCHVINSQLSGRSYVGGLGGTVGSWDTIVIQNSSASGTIYADRSVGGLLGSVQSNTAFITNCYALCDIFSLGKQSLILRGGLIGANRGVVYNCYSAGTIEYDHDDWYNYTGLSLGDISIDGEMHNVYALQYDNLPFEGRDNAMLPYSYVLSDTAQFNNSCILNAEIEIDGTSYTDLLSALNAWVDANNEDGKYRRWAADTENVNGGFPIFYTTPKYEIIFKNEDGTILQTSTLEEGEMPVAPEVPAKESTARYTYTFAGWDHAIAPATGNDTYIAVFTPQLRSYTITFLDEDGTVLESSVWDHGCLPSLTIEPTKAATAQYTYTFTGWDRTIAMVTCDTSYTATYTATVNKYLITFANEDGTTIVSQEYDYGSMPVAPTDPIKEATAQYTYTFAGWDKEIVAVTGAATYTATFSATVNKYLITFLNDDESILCAEEWEYGATPSCDEPTKEADGQYAYSFAGWQPEIVTVKGIATYTATYNALSNPTALPTNEQPTSPVKVIENGNIFILRYGKTYTVQGQEVR